MSEVVEKKEVSTDFLENRTVVVRFLPRKLSRDITDKNHVAYGGKLEGCFDFISPPKYRKDKLKNVLTNKEKDGLESLMRGVNLSIYSDFWSSFKRGSIFPIRLGKDDLILNLSDPEDYIRYKVILNSNIVANSEEELMKREGYKYVIIDEDKLNIKESESTNNLEKAFSLYSDIKGSKAKLRFVLNKFGKNTDPSHTLEFLQGETGKEIKSNTTNFINLVSDDLFRCKVVLNEAFMLGIIQKMNNQYFDENDKPISEEGKISDEENAAYFLSKPVGQETRLILEKRIKNARE